MSPSQSQLGCADAHVRRILHDAHLRYQRERLARDASASGLPAAEVRGCKRELESNHATRYANVVQPSWFTHVRPNTVKVFIQSQMWYATNVK
jgi:hypothetical protein